MKPWVREEILNRLKEAQGHVGFYYKNLDTGKEIGFHEQEIFHAASIIKLPILAAICYGEALGTINMTEKIQIKQEDKVPSCGALRFFPDGSLVDVNTLCHLMIAISDNTATNLLIKRFGIDDLNRSFLDLGLKKTMIHRMLFDAQAAEQGKENVFVPQEIGQLLEKVAQRQLMRPKACEKVVDILLTQQINHKIPGKLPKKVAVAHKTGEDTGITNDVGIVYGEQGFILAFASNATNVPQFEEIIRDISLMCYQS